MLSIEGEFSRNGGAFHTFMTGPDGGESDNPGLFLDGWGIMVQQMEEVANS
jgi:hypothetical protein